MDKVYSTVEERIALLKSRNLSFEDSAQEVRILKKYNYYNLINGYKDPFLYSIQPERYLDGTTLDELEALKRFDQQLRLLFLERILEIEELMKHEIVQAFFEHETKNETNTADEIKQLHKQTEYLRDKYFNLQTTLRYTKTNYQLNQITTQEHEHMLVQIPENTQVYEINRTQIYHEFHAKMHEVIAQQSRKNDSIQAYTRKHGYVPFWVLMNVCTFGNISSLFTILKQEVQLKVIHQLLRMENTSLPDDKLILNVSRLLEILTINRNLCAHNERFYCSQTKVKIDDDFMQFGLILPHYYDAKKYKFMPKNKKKIRLQARQGIYALIFTISVFLHDDEGNAFKMEIQSLLNELEEKLKTISISEIERLMGLNFDWFTKLTNAR